MSNPANRPIPGTVDEWVEFEPNRYERTDHPEDGIITLREGLSFAEYYAERETAAAAADAMEDEPLVTLADLQARIAKLEAKRK